MAEWNNICGKNAYFLLLVVNQTIHCWRRETLVPFNSHDLIVNSPL